MRDLFVGCAGPQLVAALESTRPIQPSFNNWLLFSATVEAGLKSLGAAWDHMRVEETELLPLAEKYLTAADWLEIDTAFLGHTDPLLGAEVGARYDTLFSRIVNLAPPPIGLGPET